MPKPELRICHLTKTYDKQAKPALADFSADFSPGVYGILGPNGAGKSTLFKLLGGLLAYDDGRILWQGSELQNQRFEFALQLGYMPQQQGLFDYLKVSDFLSYFALLKRLKGDAIPNEIGRVMRETGIADLQNRKIAGLSGGMKQRVLLAQALLAEPKVLLLDEPTAGLDPQERIRFRNFIAAQSLDKIVLIATHIVSDIDSTAKDVLFLDQGRLIEAGSVSQILGRYAAISVRGLIPKAALSHYSDHYLISHIQEKTDGMLELTLVGDWNQAGVQLDHRFERVPPGLEDVYLYLFKPGTGSSD